MNKKLKQIISVMLVLLMCMTAAPLNGFVGLDLGLEFTASATGSSLDYEEYTLGANVTGTLNTNTGVLTISGSGAMKNYSNNSAGYYSPLKGNTDIKEVVFEDGVTTVGDSAFTGCTSLKKVTLSDTVTSIGTYVFMSCSSFEEIHLGKAVKSIGASALDTGSDSTSLLKTITVDSENANYTAVNNVLYSKDMKTLVRYAPAKTETTYTFPATVNKISGHAFYGARNLKSIAIPEGITEIYGETFYDCRSLETVTFPSTLKKIYGYNAFYGCSSLTSVTLPEGFTEIGMQTFLKCTKLKTVNLPDSLTTIAAHAFSNCNALTDIKIPANVTSLGRSCAFYNCSSLTSIEIPEGVTEIPYGTFEYCYALKSVTIPSTVTKIEEFAFYGCNVLETVNYNGSPTMWNNISIDDTSSSGETTGVNDKLKNATINYAYEDGNKLGDNIWYKFDETTGAVTLVGSGDTYNYSTSNSPFSNNTNVKSVTVGEGITGIGNYVFYYCRNLAKLSLPSTLESIGERSFYYHALTEITIPDSVTSIGNYALAGTKLTKLHIGKGLTTFDSKIIGDNNNKMTTLTVSKDNPSFTAVDNVLFNKDVTEFVYVPMGITKHTIPGTITTLPEGVFQYRTKLEEITIPASITEISNRAFDGCTGLKTVTISASTTKIGDYAFYNTALTDVYYGGTRMQWKKIEIGSNNAPLTSATIHYTNPESQKLGDNVYYEIDEATGELLIYGSGTTYDFYTNYDDHICQFNGNTTIKKAVVEEGVTVLGENLFYGCASLESVELPNTLTTIKYQAFFDTAIKSITIPASVTNIDISWAFNGATKLESINVDNDNETYSSIDGVLFNKDQTMLYLFPMQKTYGNYQVVYTVPSTVTSIASGAFKGTYVTTLKIPESVTVLQKDVFYGNQKLRYLYLPSTLTKIESGAFNEAGSNFKDVYYSGTPAQWEAIEIGTDKNEKLLAATMHYDISCDRTSGDDAWFTYDEATGAVVISGTGETANFYEDFSGLEIKSVEVGNGITYIGSEMFKDHTELTTVVLGDKIEKIGNYAFYNTGIETLSIPDSVERLGEEAFSACANLKTIDIGKGLIGLSSNPFAGLPSLEKITVDEENTHFSADNDVALIFDTEEAGVWVIVYAAASTATEYAVPNGVDIIDDKAFNDATNLQKVTLSDRVAYVEDEAFSGCTNLTEITLPSIIDTIGTDAFKDTALTDVYYDGTQSMWTATGITADQINNATVHYLYSEENKIGDNVYYKLDTETGALSIVGTGAIYDYAAHPDYGTVSPFYENENIKSVTIAEGVTTIGNCLFIGCADLTSVTFPTYSLETIGESAFHDCKLTSVTIPDTVTSTGDCAFGGMKTLETVHLGTGLTTIGKETFWETGIKTLTVSEENANFTVVDNVLFNKDKTTLVYYSGGLEATEYTVPKTVKTISDYAFALSKLENVIVQDGVTNINYGAFFYCQSLKTITLPKTLTNVDKFAFYGDEALTDVYYTGAPEMWSVIYIGASNRPLDNATRHYQIGKNAWFTYDAATCAVVISGTGSTDEDRNKQFKNITVKSIVIGKEITGVDEDTFSRCTDLESITVAEGNENLVAEDNVLYNKDKTKIIRYAPAKTDTQYTMPNTVTVIAGGAFEDAVNLEKVTSSDKLTEIKNYAFNDCTALTEITLPETIETIMVDPFYGSGLTDVYYEGTQSMWNKVRIYDVWITNNATVHYLYDEANKLGDNVYYKLDSETGELSLIGTGVTYDYTSLWDDNVNLSPLYENKDIKSIKIDEGITGIGNNVFPYCSNVTSVTFPTSLESIGNNAFDSCYNIETLELPEGLKTIGENAFYSSRKITSVYIPDSVTEIGTGAFTDNAALTSVTVGANNENFSSLDGILFNKDKTTLILYPVAKSDSTYVVPETVTTISNGAFYGTTNLRRVELHNTKVETIGSSAFYSTGRGDESIQTITLPSTLKTIGDYAFNYCYALTDVYFYGTQAQWNAVSIGSDNGILTGEDADEYGFTPATIHCIVTGQLGENVYYTLNSWDGIVNITGTGDMYDYTNSNLSPFCNNDKIKSVTIGEGVTSVGEHLFGGCDGLTSVTLPTTLKKIGEYAFSKCDFESVTIPGSVETIGDYAFSECTSLATVTISNGVKTIGDYAFYNCSVLKNITFPESLESIGNYVFIECIYLTNITVDANNKNYSSVDGVLFNKDKTTLVLYPQAKAGESYSVPESVTAIADQAFYQASNLKSITMSNNVKTLGAFAFMQCLSLESITLSNQITTIPEGAFVFCFALKSVEIPNGVTTIGEAAFYYCSALTDVYYNGTKAEWDDITIGNNNDPLKNATIHFAYDGKLGDNVYYKLDEATGELTITGSGDMYTYDYHSNTSPFYNNQKVKSVKIGEGVTSVGSCVFYCCYQLTTVTLPTTLKKIDEQAFRFSGLTSVTIPGTVETIGNKAFQFCKSLAVVTISNGVKTIGHEAFGGCTQLGDITIPESVQSIGMYNFNSCKAINVVESNSDYTSVDGVLFNKDKTALICYPAGKPDESYSVPAGVTTIEESAFYYAKNIKSVTMTNDVTTLGIGILQGCEKLENVTLSNKITTISDGTFYYCTALKSIVIPEGVTDIAYAAFFGCEELKTVTLPHSLKSVGYQAFAYYDDDVRNNVTLKVETVYYNACSGQKGDFANITFDECNECIKNADVICIGEHEFGDVQHKDLSCLEDGYDYKQCSSCKLYYACDADVKATNGADTYEGFVTSATGHTFTDVPFKAANCTEDGNEAYKFCSVCNKYFDTTADVKATNGADNNGAYVITATDHSYTGAIKMDSDGKDGKHSFACVNGCGTFGNATAHVWDGGKETTAATHLKEGVMTYTCTCGATKTEPIAKSAEHTYTTNVVEPTCTQQGYTEHICACGDKFVDSYVDANGHHYENGNCTECGEADPDYNNGGENDNDNDNSDCDCICHNSNKFVQFIYKIVRWFWKLFNIRKTCGCGAAHY